MLFCCKCRVTISASSFALPSLQYIAQLIETMEAQGLRPLPIFINGVEAHTVVGWLLGWQAGGQRMGWLAAEAAADNTSTCQACACASGLPAVPTTARSDPTAAPPPASTQVRDQLTTAHEQELLRRGEKTSPTLSRDAVLVDAVVNTGTLAWVAVQSSGVCLQTGVGCLECVWGAPLPEQEGARLAGGLSTIHALEVAHASPNVAAQLTCRPTTTVGFPLVGGPAGTMEGGRQSEIAKAILSTKNVPYVVAAPLLIQVRRKGWGGWGGPLQGCELALQTVLAMHPGHGMH